jgi:hypothetical protein
VGDLGRSPFHFAELLFTRLRHELRVYRQVRRYCCSSWRNCFGQPPRLESGKPAPRTQIGQLQGYVVFLHQSLSL